MGRNNIELELITTELQRQAAKQIIENHHSYVPRYLSVGRRIDWLIKSNQKLVGMIGIGSSVYPPPKDLLRYLDLTKEEYRGKFNSIANNWRFCLSISSPNLGTQVLSKMRREAVREWKKKYNDTLEYIITFVGGGNSGAVYKADNWTLVGLTAGLPPHKSSSMKWMSNEELKTKFVKPTGENRKLIFVIKTGGK